jgi:tetratricopeptide (TPR) repeat protein
MKFLFPFFFLCCCWNLIGCRNPEDPQPVNEKSVTDPLQLAMAFPDSALLQEQLIQYYRDSGQYEKAMEHTARMLEKDSMHPRWSYILATLACEKGDTAVAIEILDRAFSLFPERRSVILLGILLARKGDKKALALAEQLKSASMQGAAEGYFIAGTYLAARGEKEKAIIEFDRSLNERYSFIEAYREKALLLIDLQKYEEALEVLNKAVTIRNDFEEGYYYRGRCLEKTGRIEEAAESYRMALLYDPQYEEARQAMENMK